MADLNIKFQGEQVDVLKNIDKILSKLDGLEKKLDGVGETTKKTASKMESTLAKAGKRIGSSVTRMVSRVTMLLGAGGLTGVFVGAVKKAKDFETAMAEVGTLLTGESKKQVESYSKAIRDLSKNSSFTAAELSKGLYQVISAGSRGTETAAGSMKLLDAAQKAAVAGVAGVFESVDVLTTSLNAYGMSADDASKFTDTLFTTVRLGKTTFPELASQLGMVVSIAANAGVTFEEVNAALAAMTKSGLSTDIATTSLRGMLIAMMKPSTDLKKALGDPAAVLRKRGLLGAMEMVAKAAHGDSAAMTKLIPDVRALAGASILAGTGLDNFRDAVKQMGESAGATNVAYNKMSDTFEQRSKKFWNILSDALINIGNELLPDLISGMESFSKWVVKNGSSITAFFKGLLTVFETLVKVINAAVRAAQWLGESAAKIYLASSKSINRSSDVMRRMMAERGYTKATGGAKAVTGAYGMLGEQFLEQTGPFPEKAGAAGEIPKVSMEPLETAGSNEKVIKAWQKQRAAALQYLHRLELSNMEKLQRLKVQFEDDITTIQRMRGLKEEERTHALDEREKKYLADRGKIQDGIDSAHLKMLREGNKIDAEISKRQLETQRAIAASAMSGIGGFLGGIGGAELETEQEQRAYAFAEKTQEAMSKPGFWDSVTAGFYERIGEGLYSVLQSAADGILRPYSQVLDLFSAAMSGSSAGAIKDMLDGMLNFWSNLIDNLDPVLNYLVGEGIPKLLDAATKAIPHVIKTVAKYLPDLLGEVVGSIPNIISAVIDSLPNIINAVIASIPRIVNALIAGVPEIIISIVKSIPMIAIAFAKAAAEAVLSMLTFGIGKKKKGGSLPGTAENPLITQTKEDLAKRYPGMDPTHAAAQLSKLESGGWSRDKGMTWEEWNVERDRLKKYLSAYRATTKHEGGFLDAVSRIGRAVRAHNGVFVASGLSADEVPVIAQTGEAILNRDAAAAVGGRVGVDALNSGAGSGNVYIEWRPEHAFVEDSARVIDRLQSDLLRKRTGGVFRSLVPALAGFTPRR